MSLPADPWGLNEREREIVSLLFDLDSNKMIARRLGIARQTGEAYCSRAFKKMGVQSRTGAAVVWDRWKREQAVEVA